MQVVIDKAWCFPVLDHRPTTTVSSVHVALVLPSVQGGGASTRTSLEVRTNQIRGTHEFSLCRAA